MSWWQRWVWPAGGSGGVPGDVLGTLYWVAIAGIISAFVYPPLRRWIVGHFTKLHADAKRREDMLRHLIKHHPDVPDWPEEGSVSMAVLLAACLTAAIVLGVWWGPIEHAAFVFTGARAEPGAWYGWWSGFAGGIGIFGIFGVSLVQARRFNCGVKGCWRLGHHEYEMDGVKHVLCRRHHPHTEGKITAEAVAAHHDRERRRYAMQVEAVSVAEAQEARRRRSEAARKGVETRRRNAAAAPSKRTARSR